MEQHRDSLGTEPSGDGDLTALAWVHEELRRSLDTAHKSLRRLLREVEQRSGAALMEGGSSPAVHQARTLVHQSVGVLEMIGLDAPARGLGASERLLQRLSAGPSAIDPALVAAVERMSFAVLDYLGRLLAGQAVSPLALFPAYRETLRLAGAERVHPADLWSAPDPAPLADLPVEAAPLAVSDPRLPAAVEASLLDAMRGQVDAQARLSRLFAGLAAGAPPSHAPLWQLASAFYEAQSWRVLQPDVYAQRLGSRLLAQLRASAHGVQEVPQRLLQDLSFFCARARRVDGPGVAPRLSQLRQALALPVLADEDYEDSPLGRFDPSLVPQARRRLGAFKDIWAVAAAGDVAVLSACAEQVALVAESTGQLYPGGDALGLALVQAVQRCAASGQAPEPELSMEMATTLLCLDATLDELDRPDLASRIARLTERLQASLAGQPSPPIEPWMESLYREVSDRQTMGSVVQELRAALAEVEQQLDRFHRHREERELLIPVPAQLATMRGVLSVLGLGPAAQAVQRMRQDVDRVIAGDASDDEVIARLADNLGVMSFLIDMLGVQPHLAKSLFHFDADTGRFTAVMGRGMPGTETRSAPDPLRERTQAVVEGLHAETIDTAELGRELAVLSHHATAADEAGLARAASEALAALERSADDADARADLAQALEAVAAEPAPLAPAAAPSPAPLDDDEDMREVFFEEAAEVMEQARESLDALRQDPKDLGAMTAVRRAFHTLKGSSRMVHLKAFGEAAWACERLYNTRLALAEAEVDADLQAFSRSVLDELQDWTATLARQGDDGPHDGLSLIARADALRLGEATALTSGPVSPLVQAPVSEPEAALVPASTASREPEPLAQPEPALAEAVASDVGEPTPEPVAPALSAADLPDLELPDLALPDLELPDLALPADPVPAAEATAPLDLPRLNPATEASTDARADLPALDFELDLDLDDEPAPSASDTGLGLLDLPLDEPLAPSPILPEAAEAVAAPAEAPATDPVEPPSWDETRSEAPPELQPVALDVDLDLIEQLPAPPARTLTLVHSAPPPAPLEPDDEADRYKVVGALRVPIALFNIYLNEADEQSRRLCTELAEWQLELDRPVGEAAVALAHSMAGNSATVGYAELSGLARRLEHQLEHAHARGRGQAAEAQLFQDVAEEIRRLLHQFAAGILKPVPEELEARLAAHEQQEHALVAQQVHAMASGPVDLDEVAPADAGDTVLGTVHFTPLGQSPEDEERPLTRSSAVRSGGLEGLSVADVDAIDAVDPELLEIFLEEARQLLPELADQVRLWAAEPQEPGRGIAAMRALHTLKGGARLAGAMRLGEMAHRLETAVERLAAIGQPDGASFAALESSVDTLDEELQRLVSGPAADEPPAPDAAPPMPLEVALAPVPDAAPAAEAVPAAEAAPVSRRAVDAAAPTWDEHQPAVDWAAFSAAVPATERVEAAAIDSLAASSGMVRVRAQVLDRLVSHAGEVGTARGRIDAEVGQMRTQLRELTDNLERLRRQLRDLELQAETQMASRLEAARQSQQSFDPLEMDRFTRVQELTRMLTESVGDVGTVQRGLQQSLAAAEDQLAAQSRLTRDLQDDLLRARMVEFDTVSDRLYRVVRQAAKESGKQVRLNITGGQVELDRSVLDRMTPSFEHLLRNAVVHGIEAPALREATGKPAAGTIEIQLRPSGNEVRVEVRDDGAGLDLVRIAERARVAGLLAEEDRPTEADLAQLIFRPGFSTADQVTELAGRGIGMDVVRSEVTAMGGRVETSSASGQGTAFRLVLPLTTAVTQVVAVDCAGFVSAVPSVLVEQVRRVPAAEVRSAYASGVLRQGDRDLPFFWLGGLLEQTARGVVEGRTAQVLVVRSASQRVAVHVGEVLGNQEVVVKHLGPQLSRLPGLTGMSLLAGGQTVLIYNPVALAAVYGEAARERLLASAAESMVTPEPQQPAAAAQPQAPLILVVDDSLTVRRVTQRLLQREGYRVALARDGLEALEALAAERPALMLSDIEMPRMDGFDLLRNVRAEPRWADLPVVMITSRIAEKHRDHARELGVDHYLGKPYDEDVLLDLLRQMTSPEGVSPA